jgi:hypothetical protein
MATSALKMMFMAAPPVGQLVPDGMGREHWRPDNRLAPARAHGTANIKPLVFFAWTKSDKRSFVLRSGQRIFPVKSS